MSNSQGIDAFRLQAYPPGWYQDPWNPNGLRWWDGAQWTVATSASMQQGSQIARGQRARTASSLDRVVASTPMMLNAKTATMADASSMNPIGYPNTNLCKGWYRDPYGRADLRFYNGERWTYFGKRVPDCAQLSDYPVPLFSGALPLLASDIDSETGGSTKRYPFDINEYPAIANWQKAPAFSVLGFLARVFAWRLIALFVVTIATGWIAGGIFTNQLTLVVFPVASLIYAAFVYPSFFEEKPLLRSNKAISFWNVFFGGPILGWFWNGNLSYSWISNRCEIGVSHIVLVTLCVLYICTMVVGIFIAWG